MKAPLIPDNEFERLQDLNDLNVLDTEADPQLDELVELASIISGCQIALVSLVDKDRQWFKAKFGLTAKETSRDISFCGHAILENKMFEVKDASKDTRFLDNPLVTSGPNIRFYAGTPLVSSHGFSIGTLCVIDPAPRELDETQKRQLQILSNQVMRLLENRRIAEKDRARNTAQLAHLNQLSHEIRTPLTSIVGYLTLLRDDLVERDVMSPESQRFIQSLEFSSDHLMEMVNDVMSFSKLSSGDVVKREGVVPTSKFFAQIADLFRLAASKKKLDLMFYLDPNAPTQFGTDEALLRQVMINLVGNAVKFTAEGSVELHVRFENDNKELVVDVVDTGIGMDQAEVNRLFRPYAQANDKIATKFQGTGLGLYISRGITEVLGGYLTVERSEKGVGSLFRMSIPVTLETAPAIRTSSTVSPMPKDRKVRLLLVDDSPENRFLFRHYIKDTNIEIVEAENGHTAFEQFRSSNFDYVFLDMLLPDMNGNAVMDGFKRQRKPTFPKVFAFTALSTSSEEASYLTRGFAGLLPKPFNAKVLRELLGIRDGEKA